MRWVYIGLAASLLMARSETQALAASQNEPTIIQAAATGISIDPADQASITLNLRQSAATELEARAKLRAFTEQVTAELSALGVPKRVISFEESTSILGYVRVQGSALEGKGRNPSTETRPVSAAASLKLTNFDPALLPKLRPYLDQKGDVVPGKPEFSLSDSRKARNAAIADGIKQARLDADAYAAALGTMVTRVISAGDQAAQSSILLSDQLIEKLYAQSNVRSGMVKTSVNVIVRVAVEPR